MLEIEAKFHVANLNQVEGRLVHLGATLIHPRLLEHNDRFDTPHRSLSAVGQVLRLRQADRKTLTFKKPSGQEKDGLARTELELEIGDMAVAAEILQSLGFIRTQSYEKYRRTFAFRQVQVMMDELPYGDFVELEGPNVASIQSVAETLNLSWEKRVEKSYLVLFNDLCQLIIDPPNDLTFTSPPIKFPPLQAIDIQPAD